MRKMASLCSSPASRASIKESESIVVTTPSSSADVAPLQPASPPPPFLRRLRSRHDDFHWLADFRRRMSHFIFAARELPPIVFFDCRLLSQRSYYFIFSRFISLSSTLSPRFHYFASIFTFLSEFLLSSLIISRHFIMIFSFERHFQLYRPPFRFSTYSRFSISRIDFFDGFRLASLFSPLLRRLSPIRLH